MGLVRTTIALDADVAAEVDRLRRTEGVGISEAVNALARRGMVPTPRDAPYEFTPQPLRALIDLTNVAEVLEMIEDDNR